LVNLVHWMSFCVDHQQSKICNSHQKDQNQIGSFHTIVISMIPKIIHQIWVGGKPMPERYKQFGVRIMEMYSECTYYLWDDHNRFKLKNEDLYLNFLCSPSLASDIFRYELMYKYGGLYLDTDMEPVNKMPDSVWESEGILVCPQFEGFYGTALLGSDANNGFWLKAMESLASSIYDEKNCNIACWQSGPTFLSKKFVEYSPVLTQLPKEMCYPSLWDEEKKFNPSGYFFHHYDGGRACD
jgi:mannosyltransferase OCH1-like enzyme